MRIREIDGLRAIAALAVVSCHYFTWIKYSGAQYLWLGVDLFFVISGFLITSILLGLKSNPGYFRTFYGRRAFRIFPPYFFVLAIYLTYSLAIRQAGSVGLWMKYFFYYASLLFSSNHQYGIDQLTYVGLSVLWSLSVEELFYICWAPAIRLIERKYFGALLAGIIIAAPVLRWALHSHSQAGIFTFYCRMDGLAFGSLVAFIVNARRRSPASFAAFDRICDYAVLLSGAIAVAFFAVAGPDYQKPRVTVPGITIADLFFATLVYYLVRHSGERSLPLRAFRVRPLRSIGMVSYSLYLVHFPLLIVSENICSHFHLKGKLDAFTIDGIGLALSFAAAYAMWYGFESYSLHLKDRLFPSPAPTAMAETSLA